MNKNLDFFNDTPYAVVVNGWRGNSRKSTVVPGGQKVSIHCDGLTWSANTWVDYLIGEDSKKWEEVMPGSSSSTSIVEFDGHGGWGKRGWSTTFPGKIKMIIDVDDKGIESFTLCLVEAELEPKSAARE